MAGATWSGAAVLAQRLWDKYKSPGDRDSRCGWGLSDQPSGGVGAGGPQTPIWSRRLGSKGSSMAMTYTAAVDNFQSNLCYGRYAQ